MDQNLAALARPELGHEVEGGALPAPGGPNEAQQLSGRAREGNFPHALGLSLAVVVRVGASPELENGPRGGGSRFE